MPFSPKDLRILALKSVIKPDLDYFYRHVFRWYSREFSTPLYMVETFPLDEILIAYYESRYEDLTRDDDHGPLIEELKELTQNKYEALRSTMQDTDVKQAEDEEYIRVLREELEREKERKAKNEELPLVKSKAPVVEMPNLPDIKLKFEDASPDELETWDVFGPPRKEK